MAVGAVLGCAQGIAGGGVAPMVTDDGGMVRGRPSRVPGRAVCHRFPIHMATVSKFAQMFEWGVGRSRLPPTARRSGCRDHSPCAVTVLVSDLPFGLARLHEITVRWSGVVCAPRPVDDYTIYNYATSIDVASLRRAMRTEIDEMTKKTAVGAADDDGDGFDHLLGVTLPVSAMRVKLGPEDLAGQPDALGRRFVGWREGLSASDLWDRGRGVWKAKAKQVIESDVLLIAFDGEVKLLGTVEGITKHGDRLAILGRPIADHPLIGKPDPLHNRSSNPVAYGSFDTSDILGGRREQALRPLPNPNLARWNRS